MNDIENLRATAAALMNAADECTPVTALIGRTVDLLLRIHPTVNRTEAQIACERAAWAGWP